MTDHVNSTVGHPARHPSFGAGAPLLTFKPEREFQLQVWVLLKVRHGDRQQRDGLLVRVLRQNAAHQLFGDFGKDRRRRNRRIERYRTRDRAKVGEADANRDSPARPGFGPQPAANSVRKMAQCGYEDPLLRGLPAKRGLCSGRSRVPSRVDLARIAIPCQRVELL